MRPAPIIPRSPIADTRGFVDRAVFKTVSVYAAFAALWIVLSDRAVLLLTSEPETISLISTLKGWFFVIVTSLLLAYLVRHYMAQLASANDEVRLINNDLESTVNAIPDLLFETDEQGRIYAYRASQRALLAAPPEMFLGKRFEDVLPQEAAAVCMAAIEKAAVNGHHSGMQYELLLGQERKWFELSVARKELESTEQARFIVLARDVTERVLAQQALIDKQAQHQAVLQMSQDGFWRISLQGRLLEVNEAYCRMSGYSNDELTARMVSDLEQARTGTFEALDIDAVVRLGAHRFESRHRRRDGSMFVVEVSAQYRPSGGDCIALFLRDITERKMIDGTMAFLARSKVVQGTEGFFRPLARYLAGVLDADYICIDRLVDDHLSAETLAVFFDGEFDDNLVYRLQDTPCGEVVGQQVCVYQAGVRHLFPKDAALQDLQAEGYLGVTLWSSAGEPIGLIAVISRTPIGNVKAAESILKLVAVRAAGELERENAEATLQASEMRFRHMLQIIPAVSVQGYGPDGTTRYWNHASELLYGYTAEEAIGRNLLDLMIPAFMHQGVREAMQQMFETGQPIPTGELTLMRKDGSAVDVLSSHAYVQVPGQPPEMFCVDIDLTERKQAADKLQLAASVFTHAREGIFITDAQGVIVDVNEAFTRITGYGQVESLGQTPRMLRSNRHPPEFFEAMWKALCDEGHWYGEVWNLRKNGETYAEMLTISAVRDSAGVIQHYVALFTDITPMKVHEQELEHTAHFDALTQLPNRVLLSDRLEQAIIQSQRRKQSLAVVFLDLDGFKAVNDLHGHDVGDEFLVALAQHIKAALREGDTLARIGGDEFVAVLVDLEHVQDFEPVVQRMLQATCASILVGDLMLQVSASMGVTIYPQDGVDAELLMRHADQAMYEAKHAGKNRYQLFDVNHDSAVKTQRESLERIRCALNQGEFVLYYQPKVNMKTGQVIGAEALIRWQHPQQGLLAPGTFLPLIEDHPISVDLGEWVIASALAQMVQWQRDGLALTVSVNIGARQLQQAGFSSRLAELLAGEPQVAPQSLQLEVLETSFMNDINQVSGVMRSCTELGVAFALDDFGTGYSSLTYLRRLPAALLKIDQSFVRDMLSDPDDLAIVKGVIGLAGAMGREVIAEGVETAAHGNRLLALGCDMAQGYGIARPMPAQDVAAWVARWHANPVWTA